MAVLPAKKCELIAPAGSIVAARAAVENGADAIYFGLQKGMNARARATNFPIEELPAFMFYLHQRGVKGYLTLNTLLFAEELEGAEKIARQAIRSGVDAFIVQDLGLLRLLHEICPEFPLHASTQMTLSSAACIEAAAKYGVQRVVLPRELSAKEIAAVHEATPVELEVFAHGALCIGYSGQCTASLALGGRSGNRGQCAQACRMAYEWLDGGESLDDEAKRYWLSPRDLALWDRLPEMLAAGVSALKIEGRLKEPEYVALATRCYRRALDAALAGKPFSLEPQHVEELEVTFSRGFSSGWFDGPKPHDLVPGKNTAKRGVPIGTVKSVGGDRVEVLLSRSVRRGQGVVFEQQHDQDAEQGGRIYEIFVRGRSIEEMNGPATIATESVELAFGRNDLDLRRIQPGQRIYRTDDPQLMKELRKTFEASVPQRRVPLDIVVRAAVGEKLLMEALAGSGAHCEITSEEPLAEARKHPLTLELLREQFGRLGETPYQLRYVNAKIDGRPMTPLSVLGQLRRAMVTALDESIRKSPDFTMVGKEPLLPKLREEARRRGGAEKNPVLSKPLLHVLCRSVEQVEAASGSPVDTIYADFLLFEEYARAVSLARFAGKKIFLATTRIHRPESAASLEFMEKIRPDGVLARHLAAVEHFHRLGMPVTADYALNAANDLAVETLRECGAGRVTAAFDLNQRTFEEMLRYADPAALEVILHGHVPMFHTAHCLYCAVYSEGDAKPACGRPCLKRKGSLRDRKGYSHPVLVDADCRNMVLHGQPQSLTEYAAWLTGVGVRHFRIELLDHTGDEAADLIGVYRDLLDGRRDENDVLRRLAMGRFGDFSRGTWRFDQPPVGE